MIDASPVSGVYEETVDRATAYEMLKRRSEGAAPPPTGAPDDGYARHGEFRVPKIPGRGEGAKPTRASGRDTPTDTFLKSLARSVGTVLPRILERVLRGGTRR